MSSSRTPTYVGKARHELGPGASVRYFVAHVEEASMVVCLTGEKASLPTPKAFCSLIGKSEKPFRR